ncbi:hypothetical protein [Nocardioides jiangxiensis]|uniref:Membrane associated serine protease, rhomboid family n=1 Tax=Nocardioides jiangxiensis TaxID=3064524 RepID=A0ABT9B2T5_9ACTN|nr:hypothetical protein [Nocardioides sp. WY-20]MDO7869171.1 hypothetical protein [Nocardioides sp. WY-20]
MRRRFRMSPSGGGPHDPWFRIGTLEVGTSVGIALLGAIGLFVSAVVGFGSPAITGMVLNPYEVAHGQVWRLVTWPFAFIDGTRFFFDALTIAMLWYFGRDLEENLLGRRKMLQLVGLTVLAFDLVAMAIYFAFDGAVVIDYSLNTVELVVLLAWIAEWPHRRFLFNIPAWVIGLVLVGIDLIVALGYRDWYHLLYLVLGLVLSAIAARSIGMLSEHHIVPHVHLPRRRPRRGAARHEHGPRARRTHRHPSEGPTVVAGPWQGSSVPTESPDEARMNVLLEKIHASGQASLTSAEQKELLALRDRLRRRG